MAVKEKVQCPVRLYEDQYKQVKVKIVDDKITFQKLIEVLVKGYLKNNKEIMRLVRRYSDEKNSKKRRYELDSMERDEIARMIQKEYSPLREAIKEIEDEK